VLYPNPNGNGEKWIGRTYGAKAPVLIVDPETNLYIGIEEEVQKATRQECSQGFSPLKTFARSFV
jgi:hypothetical protein